MTAVSSRRTAGDTVTFANGCVCCSMGDDLVGAIDRLLDGNRRPDQILVEASGVADPAPIADVATLHPELTRDLVVVLADAETLRSRHEDRRLRETAVRQLDAADLLVLNKCDRVSEGECEATESWVRDRARVPLICAINADVPVELLSAAKAEVPSGAPVTGSPERAMNAEAATAPLSADSPAHDHRFVSRTVPCPDPIDPERLRAALVALMPRVLRAKGFVVAAGGTEEEWMVVQACGRTVELERRRPLSNPGTGTVPRDSYSSASTISRTRDELAGVVRRASVPFTPLIREQAAPVTRSPYHTASPFDTPRRWRHQPSSPPVEVRQCVMLVQGNRRDPMTVRLERNIHTSPKRLVAQLGMSPALCNARLWFPVRVTTSGRCTPPTLRPDCKHRWTGAPGSAHGPSRAGHDERTAPPGRTHLPALHRGPGSVPLSLSDAAAGGPMARLQLAEPGGSPRPALSEERGTSSGTRNSAWASSRKTSMREWCPPASTVR